MRFLPIVLTALAGAALAGPASAQYALKVSDHGAENCYRSALMKARTQSAIDQCTATLGDMMLSRDDRVATLVNRGIVLMLANAPSRALRDFDAALALNANEPEAYLNKSLAEFNSGRSEAARRLANRALELRTSRPAVAYYVRGLAAEDGGNVEAAYADLRRAAAIEPKWSDPAIELRRYKVTRKL
jgi:tetratricopeptide (TPR) repeat protein